MTFPDICSISKFMNGFFLHILPSNLKVCACPWLFFSHAVCMYVCIMYVWMYVGILSFPATVFLMPWISTYLQLLTSTTLQTVPRNSLHSCTRSNPKWWLPLPRWVQLVRQRVHVTAWQRDGCTSLQAVRVCVYLYWCVVYILQAVCVCVFILVCCVHIATICCLFCSPGHWTVASGEKKCHTPPLTS